MSWHFSLALVAEYSAGNSLDGEPFAPWKSMPSAPDDSCSDKMKGICHCSPFGMMFVPSMDGPGAELLTWFLAAFPAPTYPLQARESASGVKNPAYGEKCSGSFARYDRDSCSWKTPQCSLLGDLEEYSETWPKWGLMQGGACWDQPMLAQTMTEIGSGLWPTPCHGSSHWGGTFQEVGGSKNKLRETPIGKLYVNPDFWENLMAWPIGWTGIAPLATDKTQKWLSLLGRH